MSLLSKGEPIGGQPIGGEDRAPKPRCPVKLCFGMLHLKEGYWTCDLCKLQWDDSTLKKLRRVLA
jgi:hypothetical protein